MIDIVIVTYNTKEYLKKLIDSIKQNTDPNIYKLYIVDNGSSDGTQEQFNDMGKYTYLRLGTNLGYSSASNRGSRLGNGQYLCIMNADMLVSPNWLQNLVNVMECEKLDAIAPTLVDECGYDFTQKEDWMSGACIIIKREVFEKIGGFDENYFFYYEDDDLCKTLKKNGYKFKVDQVTEIIHFHNRSPKLGNFIEENLNKSKIYFDKKWGEIK